MAESGLFRESTTPAARLPARSDPGKSQFFFARQIGQVAFSTGLLSIGRAPLSAYRASAAQRLTAPGETGSPALDLVDDPGDLPQRDHDVLNALIAGNHRCHLRGEAPHHLNLVCARRVDRE